MGCGTLIGLALSAGGAGAGAVAAGQEQNAMNNATSQEVNAQNAFMKRGQAVAQNSLAQSTPQAAQQQISQGQQQALQASKNAAVTPTLLPSVGTNSDVQNISSAGQQAKNSLSQQSNANTQGYSNYGLQQYLKDLQANSQLGVINQESARQAQIFPSMLQGAANSSQGLSTAGSFLGTAGKLVGALGNLPTSNPVASGQFSNIMGQVPSSNATSWFDPLLGQWTGPYVPSIR